MKRLNASTKQVLQQDCYYIASVQFLDALIVDDVVEYIVQKYTVAKPWDTTMAAVVAMIMAVQRWMPWF